MDISTYFPVLLFILIGIAVGIVPQVLGRLLAPYRPDPRKLSQYECGFEAFGDARMQFSVKYYLVAILFILFDLEVVFLVPWAASLRDTGMTGYLSVMAFLALVTVGFVYEWKKGAMDWE